MNCGIYQIRNLVTGFCCAGQSINLKGRPGQHWRKLKNNKHDNSHLQNSYNKHGKECFVFEVIIYCHKEYLTYYEQSFVDKYIALNISYNICRECVDSCKGVKRSNETLSRMSEAWKNRPPATEETRKKMAKAKKGKTSSMKGKHYPEEVRKNMSIAAKNKPPMSEETKKKIAESGKGRTHSEETKNKMSKSLSGKKNPNYGKRGKDAPMWGKHHSQETKDNISMAKKGQVPWNKGMTNVYSEETLKKMSENHADNSGENNPMWGKKGEDNPNFGTHHSEETKQRIGIANSNPSEETRKKMRKAWENRSPITEETKEKIKKAKYISKEKVLKIIEMLNDKHLQKDINKEMNVCFQTIRRVKNGYYNDIYNLED